MAARSSGGGRAENSLGSGARTAASKGRGKGPRASEIRASLDANGWARLPGLLSAEECREIASLYPERRRFRSFIDLGPRGYGENGDYRYFARPLPRAVQGLRTRLYSPLARVANAWEEELGSERRYPPTLREFLAECHAAGQERPTPLLLRYDPGGLNCLHQDRYGQVAFPLQVVVMLSRPARDFDGGEFLLVEQRPRQQSRGEALRLEQGEGLVFPNATRPVLGARGVYRAAVRHGVSRVLRGERVTLGLIFHDAE